MDQPFILGLTETIDKSPFLASDILFDLTGQNLGNLAFHYAISKMLGEGLKSFPWRTPPALLNQCGDIGVIPCANHLGPHADFGVLATRFSNLNIHLAAIGLGAQADVKYSIPEVPEGTLNWIREIGQRASGSGPNIGVRGLFTLDVLKHYGLDARVAVLGCPTLLINSDPTLGQRIAEKIRTSVKRIAVTAGHQKWKNLSRIESSLVKIMEATDGAYFVQAPVDFVKLARGEADQLSEEVLTSFRDYACPELNLDEFITWSRRFCRAFFNIPAWMECLRGFDFVVGTRFHGVMLGLQAGVPSMCIAHDSRTREMCETMKVPFVMAEQVKNGIARDDLQQLFNFDPDEFDANRMKFAADYVRFFQDNKLTPADWLLQFR